MSLCCHRPLSHPATTQADTLVFSPVDDSASVTKDQHRRATADGAGRWSCASLPCRIRRGRGRSWGSLSRRLAHSFAESGLQGQEAADRVLCEPQTLRCFGPAIPVGQAGLAGFVQQALRSYPGGGTTIETSAPVMVLDPLKTISVQPGRGYGTSMGRLRTIRRRAGPIGGVTIPFRRSMKP